MSAAAGGGIQTRSGGRPLLRTAARCPAAHLANRMRATPADHGIEGTKADSAAADGPTSYLPFVVLGPQRHGRRKIW
jgi:hypothetical protein